MIVEKKFDLHINTDANVCMFERFNATILGKAAL